MGRTQRGMDAIILKAAKTVLTRYGIRKTTMEEIAQAAHIAKSSIYHYYASKDEIFKVIVDQEMEAAMAEIRKAISLASTPQEKLKVFFQARFQALQQATNLYSVILDEYFENYVYIENLRKDMDALEMEILREILEEGIQRGDFIVPDVDAAIIGFRAACRGVEYYCWAVTKDFKMVEDVQNVLTNLIFYGILKR